MFVKCSGFFSFQFTILTFSFCFCRLFVIIFLFLFFSQFLDIFSQDAFFWKIILCFFCSYGLFHTSLDRFLSVSNGSAKRPFKLFHFNFVARHQTKHKNTFLLEKSCNYIVKWQTNSPKKEGKKTS